MGNSTENLNLGKSPPPPPVVKDRSINASIEKTLQENSQTHVRQKCRVRVLIRHQRNETTNASSFECKGGK